ncbi:MAG: DUF2007 domain-containing protein [Allorhizobium sp.]
MYELIRTNDPVLLSFVQSLLKDSGIDCLIADQAMSIVEGSLGMLPRRLLVDDRRKSEARKLIEDAGLADELRDLEG